MGVYLHYQAMPEGSRLFRRLRAEQPLCLLYAALIHRPAGPYDAARLPPDELDDVLAEIAGDPAFDSRPAVDRVYTDLQDELARAAEQHPGLPERSAYLKLSDEFDGYLTRALACTGRAAAWADGLVNGAEAFAPVEFGTGDVQLRLVPARLVAEAAGILAGLGTFASSEDQWAAFRGVYTSAAAHGEAVVIA